MVIGAGLDPRSLIERDWLPHSSSMRLGEEHRSPLAARLEAKKKAPFGVFLFIP